MMVQQNQLCRPNLESLPSLTGYPNHSAAGNKSNFDFSKTEDYE